MFFNFFHRIKIFFIKTRKRIYFLNADTEKVFSTIYKRNLWRSKESISGPGSELRNTIYLQKQINEIIISNNIQSITDCGCGDFNWMKELNFDDIKYTGLDIVNEIIESNNKKHKKENIEFVKSNTAKVIPPKADLIICRDVLVHLDYKTIDNTLRNMIASSSNYFLITTFPSNDNSNTYTGNWRPINLQSVPFNFPEPLKLISEDEDETSELSKSGKKIGFWNLKQLSKVYSNRVV